MSDLTKPNPNVPSIPQPIADLGALTVVTQFLKQGVDSLAGSRGDPGDRAVTFNDLASIGLTTGVVPTPQVPNVSSVLNLASLTVSGAAQFSALAASGVAQFGSLISSGLANVGSLTTAGDIAGSGGMTLTPAAGLGTSLSLTRDITGAVGNTVYYSILNYTSDDAALTGPASFGVGFNVTQAFGGPTMQGGRETFQAVALLTAPSSPSNINRNYVGGTFVGVARSGDGGTDLGAGAKGAIFGANPYFDLQAGQFFLNASCAEFDTIARAGTSVSYKSGIQICGGGSVDAVRGFNVDCMIALSATPGSVGFHDGLLIGGMNGQFPIIGGGSMIRSSGGSVLAGVDFSSTVFSGPHFNFGGLTQANNNGFALGGAPLTNQYFTVVGNAATVLPPTGTTTYALTANYSNALREFNFWNCDPLASSSFQFWQRTGVGATKVLSIAPNGALVTAGMPTSSAGLASGALWNNAGVVNVIP